MNHLLFFVLLLLIFSGVNAQVHVYPTYDHYKTEDKSETYDDFFEARLLNKKTVLTFLFGGDHIKVDSREIWGFHYKGKLFRIGTNENAVMMLVGEAPLFHWENGIRHLEMLKKKVDDAPTVGYSNYISKDLASEAFALPFSKMGATKQVVTIRNKFPEFGSVWDCVETQFKQKNYRDLRKCFPSE